MGDFFNFVDHIKKKPNVSLTMVGERPYSGMWYVDHDTRLCIGITPRSGSSVVFEHFLHLVGLLDDAKRLGLGLHNYRDVVFDKNIPLLPVTTLLSPTNPYTIIKFIINPYRRAVSIFFICVSYFEKTKNMSFRSFLRELSDPETFFQSEWTHNSKFHCYPQFIPGEEDIVTKYIRVDKNEKFTILRPCQSSNPRLDDEIYTFDVSKFSSPHHAKKHDRNDFCGDEFMSDLKNNMPSSYKLFYDDEIRHMVETIYADDIYHYEYSFDDDF